MAMAFFSNLIPSTRAAYPSAARFFSCGRPTQRIASSFRHPQLRPYNVPFRCISAQPDPRRRDGEKPGQPSWPPIPILDRMGATTTVKLTVIIFLSVLGTMETIFYVKAALRYFYPPPEDDVNANQTS